MKEFTINTIKHKLILIHMVKNGSCFVIIRDKNLVFNEMTGTKF